MREFSQLINQLILTRSRNRKIELLNYYFKNTKNPDRGLSLAILTGNLKIKNISISKIKEMIKKEVDPELFDLSYDYVGDLAETIALIWPYKKKGTVPKLDFIIDELESSSTTNITKLIKKYLSIFSENERWAFIKLLSGGLRIGVSTRLTKLSLIHNTNIEISEVEQIWHGVVPPYIKLFNWIFEKDSKPEIKIEKVFQQQEKEIIKEKLKERTGREICEKREDALEKKLLGTEAALQAAKECQKTASDCSNSANFEFAAHAR